MPFTKGWSPTPEQREKMRQAKLGKATWNKGLHGHPSCKGFTGKHTDETKAKISENRKGKGLGNPYGFQKGFTPWNKGKKHFVHTQEWRERVSEANSGPNHWNWKGGISEPDRALRNSERHKEWSKAVYKKDGWICQICGDKSHKNLVAHHIIPWKDDVSLRFEVSNGTTLCRACHVRLHKPRTKVKSPKPQLT